MNTITTRTGRRFDPFMPDIDSIEIVDIAHALGLTCRFNGHCDQFYSVAQHSIMVSRMVPTEYALAGLLHDAAEAYLGDIPPMIKRRLPGFKEAELEIEALIAEKFEVFGMGSGVIKAADREALKIEMRHLMVGDGPRPSGPSFRLMTWQEARDAFLGRFMELRNEPDLRG